MADKTIGTHNGTFHCDEVLACCMLKKLPEFLEARIVRSREPTVLAECDVVVDVGGVYDHAKRRYDHHQRDFDETMKSLTAGRMPQTIKLSSAGLVYAHYGKRVVEEILKVANITLNDEDLSIITDKVYDKFIIEIDAIDNGINQCETQLRYQINTNLSSRVSSLNPNWATPELDETSQFYKAMELVQSEFEDKVLFYAKSWLPARAVVWRALHSRNQVSHAASQVIMLDTMCPWTGHLYDLEKELQIEPTIKYALFKDRDESWRVRAVSEDTRGSFNLRLPLPEPWRGLRDDKLSQVCGIQGTIFCHHSGFIAGNHTYGGAYKMALKALGENV